MVCDDDASIYAWLRWCDKMNIHQHKPSQVVFLNLHLGQVFWFFMNMRMYYRIYFDMRYTNNTGDTLFYDIACQFCNSLIIPIA